MPVLNTEAVNVIGVVVLTVVEVHPTLPVLTAKVVCVKRDVTKVPLSGKFDVRPSFDCTVRVPVKAPRVVGFAVMGSVQSVVLSELVTQFAVPSVKFAAPAEIAYAPEDAGPSAAAK